MVEIYINGHNDHKLWTLIPLKFYNYNWKATPVLVWNVTLHKVFLMTYAAGFKKQQQISHLRSFTARGYSTII